MKFKRISKPPAARHLVRHERDLGELAPAGVGDLGVLDGKPPLVVLSPNTPTLLAFEQMATAGERALLRCQVPVWAHPLSHSFAPVSSSKSAPCGAPPAWHTLRAPPAPRSPRRAGVTGAPVIAADGELIANLSVSDIRWAEG